MKLATIPLALFIATTSALFPHPNEIPGWRKWNHSTTLETQATTTTEVVAVGGGGPTVTAPNIKDPRCKKDEDCAPGTCLNGICLAPLGGGDAPKQTDTMFSLDDLDKIPIGGGKLLRRDTLKGGKKCTNNNDCAKVKGRPWCGMDDVCVKDRPPGTECHMDTNCNSGQVCYKARCVSATRYARGVGDAGMIARDLGKCG